MSTTPTTKVSRHPLHLPHPTYRMLRFRLHRRKRLQSQGPVVVRVAKRESNAMRILLRVCRPFFFSFGRPRLSHQTASTRGHANSSTKVAIAFAAGCHATVRGNRESLDASRPLSSRKRVLHLSGIMLRSALTRPQRKHVKHV
jgi:hypothetical protein